MTSKFHQAEGGDEPNGDEDVDEGEEEADDEDDPLEESQVVMQRRYFSSNKSDEGDVFFFLRFEERDVEMLQRAEQRFSRAPRLEEMVNALGASNYAG